MKQSEIVLMLADHPEMVGVVLCGSHRMGLADRYADTDVWAFVDPAARLSDSYCLDRLIPPALALELLSEGRDDSPAPHVIYNALTDEGIFNLKFCSLELLTGFVRARPVYDHRYLEDLENYTGMRVLWERQDVITLHQRTLRERVLPRFLPALADEWVTRYASAYWRSAFQGFLRQDEHAWRLLISDMITFLADLCHLTHKRAPVPRKWALARPVLDRIEHGAVLLACLDAVAGCDVTDRAQVAACYRTLGAAEEDILDTGTLQRGFWWRSVFTDRLPNLALPDAVTAASAGIPRPARLPDPIGG